MMLIMLDAMITDLVFGKLDIHTLTLCTDQVLDFSWTEWV